MRSCGSEKAISAGTLFLVIGPSGVGKDTLLQGASDILSHSRRFRFVQRTITRPADAGGEAHKAVTDAEFDAFRENGAFLHDWSAHGLRYGIPADVGKDLARGVNVVLNTSRNEVSAFREKAEKVVPIHILASRDVLENRLRSRNREAEDDIAGRLARNDDQPKPEDSALALYNDGTVQEGIDALVDLIAGSCDLTADLRRFPVEFSTRALCLVNKKNPVASRLLSGSGRVALTVRHRTVVAELGWTDSDDIADIHQCAISSNVLSRLGADDDDLVSIERLPTPLSRGLLQRKVRGGPLTDGDMKRVVDDLVNGRFSETEIAGFLVSASTNLSMDEVVSLTRARADHAPRQVWNAEEIVVDKHSMGGIPGNRITPIVIPIVAAYGLTMPKTSSRAITSAAGTADMMEVIARVDLSPSEMRDVVRETGACIAWNGRLTHSPVDDVMNAINRPLGLASTLLDVSSIMSKKLAAGSTHVLIDLPVGPQAKTRTHEDAVALKLLFETVGKGVGLHVRVNIVDGTRPVGQGIGPVLEALDVLKVLNNAPDAPVDLLDKALDYAGIILEWAGRTEPGCGRDVALDLVRSGRALAKLNDIVQHQSPSHHSLVPGQFTWELVAEQPGMIEQFDIWSLSSIARAAGAPIDKAAGIRLLAQVGEELDRGAPILRIHSPRRSGLADARAALEQAHPVSRWRAP